VQALLLDDPQNPTALASALAQMLNDTALRARLREAGLALAREMSWTQAALKYERNFEASLRQRHS
jgi:glycosyltransferase involved in cell wall biosynthesis